MSRSNRSEADRVTAARLQMQNALVIGAATGILNRRQNGIEIKRCGFLAGREFLKRRDLTGNERLHHIDYIGMCEEPVVIRIGVFVSSLERIAPQVEQFW